jgi:hypothetical protein
MISTTMKVNGIPIRATRIIDNASIPQLLNRLADNNCMSLNVATAEPLGRCSAQKVGSRKICTDLNPVVAIDDFVFMIKHGVPPPGGDHSTNKWKNAPGFGTFYVFNLRHW